MQSACNVQAQMQIQMQRQMQRQKGVAAPKKTFRRRRLRRSPPGPPGRGKRVREGVNPARERARTAAAGSGKGRMSSAWSKRRVCARWRWQAGAAAGWVTVSRGWWRPMLKSPGWPKSNSPLSPRRRAGRHRPRAGSAWWGRIAVWEPDHRTGAVSLRRGRVAAPGPHRRARAVREGPYTGSPHTGYPL